MHIKKSKRYRSPIQVLGLENEPEKLAESGFVRKKKKELLAEFELQNSSTIELAGKSWDKDDILNYLDELSNETALAYHLNVWQNKRLFKFLTENNTEFFYKSFDEILENSDYREFLMPYLANTFQDLYRNHLKKKDYYLDYINQKVDSLFTDWQEEAFVPIKLLFLDDIRQMIYLKEEVTSGNLEIIDEILKFPYKNSIKIASNIPQRLLPLKDQYLLALLDLLISVIQIRKRERIKKSKLNWWIAGVKMVFTQHYGSKEMEAHIKTYLRPRSPLSKVFSFIFFGSLYIIMIVGILYGSFWLISQI